jgi:hypothetical protein
VRLQGAGHDEKVGKDEAMVTRLCWLIGALVILSGCAASGSGCHAQANAQGSGSAAAGGISLLTCW